MKKSELQNLIQEALNEMLSNNFEKPSLNPNYDFSDFDDDQKKLMDQIVTDVLKYGDVFPKHERAGYAAKKCFDSYVGDLVSDLTFDFERVRSAVIEQIKYHWSLTD